MFLEKMMFLIERKIMMKKSALLLPLLAALLAAQPAVADDNRAVLAKSWEKDDLGSKRFPLDYSSSWESAATKGDRWKPLEYSLPNGGYATFTWDESQMNVAMNRNTARMGKLRYFEGEERKGEDIYIEVSLIKQFTPAHRFKHIGKTADFSEQRIRISCTRRRVATLAEVYFLGKKMVYQNLTLPDPLIWREFLHHEPEKYIQDELCQMIHLQGFRAFDKL
ncbi:hypothetical protein L4G92_08795 [Neisseria sp. ZJ106]|uniref:Uncharacterized protein n=1 Tax=Neisseria lisongii TaxID=2912188 RepID=A0ABY7RHJ0_9NEIS|nr:hypothetical protein [Neisseria lisongii]MCF7522137.1 hypothetical protein [Neisseria lisongii]WCL70951.1 hypothetical protein PJU73_06195 [Neisseria lisongii]